MIEIQPDLGRDQEHSCRNQQIDKVLLTRWSLSFRESPLVPNRCNKIKKINLRLKVGWCHTRMDDSARFVITHLGDKVKFIFDLAIPFFCRKWRRMMTSTVSYLLRCAIVKCALKSPRVKHFSRQIDLLRRKTRKPVFTGFGRLQSFHIGILTIITAFWELERCSEDNNGILEPGTVLWNRERYFSFRNVVLALRMSPGNPCRYFES